MTDVNLTDEQRRALDAVVKWSDSRISYGSASPFLALTGPAGTGKSTLLREVVRLYPAAKLTAMTGKASLRATQLTGRESTTLHSALYFPPEKGKSVKFEKVKPPEGNFYIIDEASMMTPSIFADLETWAEQGVRILLVGDPYQLPPVMTPKETVASGEDYSVFAKVDGAHLTRVMRSSGGVLRAATHVRETHSLPHETDDGYEYVRHAKPLEAAVHDFCATPKDHLLVTWRNQSRMTANIMARRLLGHDGPLPDPGEPVLVKRNGQGLLNGEVIEAGEFFSGPTIAGLPTMWMSTREGGRYLVHVHGGDESKGGMFFDGQTPWIDNWRSYLSALGRMELPEPLPITWGYCLTAHAVQGSEAQRVTVFLENGDPQNKHFTKSTALPDGTSIPFSARWLYTAVSRGKKRATVMVPR